MADGPGHLDLETEASIGIERLSTIEEDPFLVALNLGQRQVVTDKTLPEVSLQDDWSRFLPTENFQNLDHVQWNSLTIASPEAEAEAAALPRSLRCTTASGHQSRPDEQPRLCHTPGQSQLQQAPPLQENINDVRDADVGYVPCHPKAPSHRPAASPDKLSDVALLRFPNLSPADADILVAEDFGHTVPISDRVYEHILRVFLSSNCLASHPSDERPAFPKKNHLNSCVQLYFEYFQPHVPILHASTFDPGPEDWLLVLAVIAVGCQHSAIENQSEFAAAFQDLLHQALASEVSYIINPHLVIRGRYE